MLLEIIILETMLCAVSFLQLTSHAVHVYSLYGESSCMMRPRTWVGPATVDDHIVHFRPYDEKYSPASGCPVKAVERSSLTII